MRTVARLATTWIALAIAVPPLAAQGGQTPRPWYVSTAHWGRWVGLAGAGTFIGLAAANHEAAQANFDDLETLCNAEPERCRIVQGAGGLPAYADAAAERLYQDYARQERAARGYLLGGQLTLVAAGGMFVLDFLHGNGPPKNIPYTPFEVYTGPDRLGLALRF